MSLVNSILNLALVFLWIDWRAGKVTRQPHAVLSLANAVRPVGRRRGAGWGSLMVLAAILLVRPLFYCSAGSKLAWTPDLDLMVFSLPWRSDLLDLMYLYSSVSFLLALGLFYAVLLLLSSVNRNLPDSEMMQQFVRSQLGWMERLPWWVKVVLPAGVAGVAWMAATPLLIRIGLLPAQPPPRALLGQAGALGLAALGAWKWPLMVLFLLQLLNVHVYLGNHPIWGYVSTTARTLLWPIRFLTFSKFDVAPLVGMAAVWCGAEFVLKPAVWWIFQRFGV